MHADASSVIQTDYPVFARIPEQLLYDPRISARAKALFAVLDRHAGSSQSCFPSRERLAGLLGCSLDTIDRALADLRTRGWITSWYERDVHRNVFVLHAVAKKGQAARVRRGKPHGCGTEQEPVNERGSNPSSPSPFVVARGNNGHEQKPFVHPYLERLIDSLELGEADVAKVYRAAHRKPEAKIVNAYEAAHGPGVRDPLAVALAELAGRT